MLRHAVFLNRQGHRVCAVFQHRYFPKSVNFVSGAEALDVWYLDEYPSDPPLLDVVVTNWWQCAYDLARLPARLYGYYRHGDEAALYQDRVFDALVEVTFREAFVWFCVSDHLAAALIDAGQQPIVLPNGVDFARFSTAPASLPPKLQPLRVLVEGPVSSVYKRVDATVTAIRTVEGVEIVHFAADGSHPTVPVNYALGAVDHHLTAGVYAACDLIVKLSAATESFAMPVLEQFAAGGTAVVSRFPGHDQYINDSNAIIVDIDQPFEIAARAVRGLRDDPRRLKALRRAAVKTARRFDWLALHQQFAATLDGAMVGRESTPQRLPVIARHVACHNETFALWAAAQERRRLLATDG
jgi:glycosyltransferase involved in cell wall biosynthesis